MAVKRGADSKRDGGAARDEEKTVSGGKSPGTGKMHRDGGAVRGRSKAVRKVSGSGRGQSRTGRKRSGPGRSKEDTSCKKWFEQLSEGIVIAQDYPLSFVYANPAMTVISGYTPEELLDFTPEKIQSLVHPDDRVPFFERFQLRIRGEAPTQQYEFRGVRKNGEMIWLTVHATRVEYEDQPAVLGAFTNITALKTAERAARENEAKLQAQFKAIPVPTYTWQRRGEDFFLVDYNDAAHEITKGSIENFRGIAASEMYSGEPDIIGDMEQSFRERRSIEREMEYRLRTTGESKCFDMKFAYVPPDLLLMHTGDITVRVKAEKELLDYKDHLEERIEERTAELRKSEARYRAIVEDQTELICRFTPRYELTFVNDNYSRYFGRTTERLIGCNFMPMISAEDRDLVRQNIAMLSRDHPVRAHDQRTVMPDGETRWQQWTNRAILDESGRIVEYQAVGRDITRRKEAEQALEESNRELGVLNEINNIINSSDDSVTILSKMLATICEYCGACYAGLYEVDHKKRELRLVTSYGLPGEVRDRVGSIDIGVASIQEILRSSGVVVAEEDIPHIPSGEYDKLKESLGLKRIISFVSRSRDRVNFLAFLGRERDEDVGDRIRRFLAIVGNQLGIALERLGLITALEKSRGQLKKLTASLMETIEEERRRMALGLHDDMGQSLIALNFEFDLMEKHFLEEGAVDRNALRNIRKQLRDITDSTRKMSYSLHPPMLDDIGLIPAIQRYVERFTAGEGLAVDIEASGFDAKLPPQIGLTLYRVVQEALTNIIKHADARHVVVQLAKGYPRVILKIEDDGKGFALEKEPPKEGLGIVSMRERVEQLGGDFRIITSPGAGTKIRVTLPLEV